MVARINLKRSAILSNADSECETRFKTELSRVSFLQPVQLAFEETQSVLKVLSGLCMQDVCNLAPGNEHCDNSGCAQCSCAECPRR